MTTTLQRLLKHPHAAVFDKSPAPDLALRIRHPVGAVWSIADGVLQVTAGGDPRSYGLSDFTVGGLAAALEADGFEVPVIAPSWQGRSALVLAEGAGDQNTSNGDHVHAFTSLLWVMLSAYSVEVREAEKQVGNALRQMVLTTAEDEWLDLWGALYGVPRHQGELDPAYRVRIKKEAFRLRVNKYAIEQAIKDATGDDVTIVEPWRRMFRLDESTLSGDHCIQDDAYYNYHVIQAVGLSSADWPTIREVVDRNRAAGVLQYQHKAIVPGVVIQADVLGSASILALRQSTHCATAIWEDRALLDYSRIEDVAVLNHASRHRRSIRRGSTLRVTYGTPWLPEQWIASGWGESLLNVQSKHTRTYRVHYAVFAYEGREWPREPWAEDWSASTLVGVSHSRLS